MNKHYTHKIRTPKAGSRRAPPRRAQRQAHGCCALFERVSAAHSVEGIPRVLYGAHACEGENGAPRTVESQRRLRLSCDGRF